MNNEFCQCEVQIVGDDVCTVFYLGELVCYHGNLTGRDPSFQWNSNRSRLRNSSNRFHDFTFYCRDDSRPFLLCQSCDGISEYYWSRTACLVINYRRFFPFLSGTDYLLYLLHAHNGIM